MNKDPCIRTKVCNNYNIIIQTLVQVPFGVLKYGHMWDFSVSLIASNFCVLSCNPHVVRSFGTIEQGDRAKDKRAMLSRNQTVQDKKTYDFFVSQTK